METLFDFLLNFWGGTPYWIIFSILLACGLGIPMPEDIVLFVLGLLSYYGITSLWPSLLVGMCGVLIGDVMIYFLGRKFGIHIFDIPVLRKIWHRERLDKARLYYSKYGSKVVFVARFLPGLRMPIYLLSGVLHLKVRVFMFYDFLAALLSVPLIIVSVYYLGFMVERIFTLARTVEKYIVIGVILVVGFLIVRYIIVKILEKREELSEGEK